MHIVNLIVHKNSFQDFNIYFILVVASNISNMFDYAYKI